MHIMKTHILIFYLINSIIINAQESKCIDYQSYTSSYDVEQIHSEKLKINSSELKDIKLQDNKLQLAVISNSLTSFSKWSKYRTSGINKGFKLFIINNTYEDINISNIDGLITFSRQVYYNNRWHTISSFKKATNVIRCGNSYLVDKIIKPEEVMTFVAPCINGSTTSKFRFVIHKKGGFQKKPSSPIYSNEFVGYFNEQWLN